MATSLFYIGGRKRITAKCYAVGTTTLIDPTNASFIYEAPDGTETTKTYPADVEVVHESTGIFHIDVDCPTAGKWKIRFVASGALVAVSEATWDVVPSNL